MSTSALVLNVWERSLGRGSVESALLLLAAAGTDPARFSPGEIDRRLLDLRMRLFGPELRPTASCPQCGEALEFQLPATQLLAERKAETTGNLVLEHEGYRIRFRLPVAEDLVAAQQLSDPAAARRLLFERCVEEASYQGTAVKPEELPEPVCAAASHSMGEADPQGYLALEVSCAACGHQWQPVFDVAGYLMREIDAWARRTLNDVHTLASRYGWAECDILALSPRRRQMYLQLAQS